MNKEEIKRLALTMAKHGYSADEIAQYFYNVGIKELKAYKAEQYERRVAEYRWELENKRNGIPDFDEFDYEYEI